MKFVVSVLTLIASVSAGKTLWSGSFNAYTNISQLDQWSWFNQVGEYQWYIHGAQPTSHYLALDHSYKNPADLAEKNGLKLTIDSSARWNSQMERTELIPQTTANLGTGNVLYHFSLKHSLTNPPNSAYEHQTFFFESHFAQLKYGGSPKATNLQFYAGSNVAWSTPFTADTLFNLH